ncbi:MAG: rRNA maturation RNase YbeY [Leptonema sp. (in: Bacteria)]|nr:rRNA maturation RNase YbeY [Leptonema sp. (in: bacteria)]
MAHRIFIDDSGLVSTAQLSRIKTNLLIGLDYIAQTESVNQSAQFELSVSFIDDTSIQKINHEFRNKDQPTDVLSFSQFEGESTPTPDNVQPLGDLVISIETAQRQAIEIGHSLEFEVTRLLVHGLYHLIGYDHELSIESEQEMQSLEDQLLNLLEEKGEIL